jgi:predicted metal-dependent enzyme (double-stranded beta helix superfamily)
MSSAARIRRASGATESAAAALGLQTRNAREGSRSVSLAGRSVSLEGVPRPRGRDLSGPELELFVNELADRPELWIDLVEHDRSQRVYRELLDDEHLTAWLICWMDEHDTGFHDHDVSAGALAVVSGAVREQRLAIDGPPVDRAFRAGGSFHFSASDIHRVRHAGDDPSVTLHVYSPPLVKMGSYVIAERGVLERHPVSYRDELRHFEQPG